MKKFLILLIAVALCFCVQAQTAAQPKTLKVATTKAKPSITKDASGNYHLAATTTNSTTASDEDTGKTLTDSKGTVYPVYKSSRGNLYILKVSHKTGNTYKYYLKDVAI